MPEAVFLYFFQGELGESISEPNAFVVKTAEAPVYGDFISHFPIHDGLFHFRFQADDKECGYVWKDMTSATAVLPTHMGIYMVKVLRLENDKCSKRRSRLRRKLDIQYCDAGKLAPAPIQTNKREILKTAQQEPAHRQRPSPTPAESAVPANASTPPPANAVPGAVPVTKPPHAAPTPPPAAPTPPPAPPPEPVLSREELVARREAAVQGQVDDALKEKRERDEAKEKEMLELDEAKTKHERSLNAWATDNGKKRNVRTLLSTMHNVIWEGSRWKAVGLGDILTPAQVKLQYRKAMLVVHTDRCSGLDTEKKFIGKRIFEAINEAYTEFLEKEG